MAYQSRNKIVTDGLVFSMDSYNTKSYVSGDTTMYDLTSNGNNGVLNNGVAFDGDSFVFDGVNDFIEIDTDLGLTGDVEITLSCWFNCNTLVSPNNTLVVYSIGDAISTGDSVGLAIFSDGSLACVFQSVWVSSFGGLCEINKWNQFTITKTPGPANTTTKLYFNGKIISIDTTTTIIPNVSPIKHRVGGWLNAFSAYFNGDIQQASTYNRALTPSEVKQNYEALKTRFQ
jgi:hypothetical protein